MKGVISHRKNNPRKVMMITQKKKAYMARMSGNDEVSSRAFGDILQLTNWILYSGATCHMTPHISNFIPGSLEDTDIYI